MRYVFFRHSLFWNAHYSSLGVYQEIQCTYMAYTGTHNGSFSPHLMQAFCHLFGGCLSLCGLEKCFHEYGLIQITKYKVTFKDTMCIHWGVYQRNPLVSSFHSQICTAHPNPTVRDANKIRLFLLRFFLQENLISYQNAQSAHCVQNFWAPFIFPLAFPNWNTAVHWHSGERDSVDVTEFGCSANSVPSQ